MGIGGITSPSYSLDISGAARANQYVEKINSLGYTATITINYNNGLLYNITGATGAVTGLTFTNVPTVSNNAYSFVFLINSTNSTYYINDPIITVNATDISLSGVSNISTSYTPTKYIMQTITLFYIGTTFTAITFANGY